MPIGIRDPEIEELIQFVCDEQPFPMSKHALVIAILNRAFRMTPRQLMAWINDTDEGNAAAGTPRRSREPIGSTP